MNVIHSLDIRQYSDSPDKVYDADTDAGLNFLETHDMDFREDLLDQVKTELHDAETYAEAYDILDGHLNINGDPFINAQDSELLYSEDSHEDINGDGVFSGLDIPLDIADIQPDRADIQPDRADIQPDRAYIQPDIADDYHEMAKNAKNLFLNSE